MKPPALKRIAFVSVRIRNMNALKRAIMLKIKMKNVRKTAKKTAGKAILKKTKSNTCSNDKYRIQKSPLLVKRWAFYFN